MLSEYSFASHGVGTCFPKTTLVKVRPTPPLPNVCQTQWRAQGYLTSATAPSLSNEPSQNGSFASPTTPKQTVSSFRIMTIKRGFTNEADQLLNCLVLARDPFSRFPHIPSGTRDIRCLRTPVPQKFCVCDLPCELPSPTSREYSVDRPG